MKMDLYLQEKVSPYRTVKVEGVELVDDLIGTWDNQRATIELLKELIDGWGLSYSLDFYKGVVRLYNNKRKARRQFKYNQGWRYVYYLPQKLYRAGVENIKVPEFPFGYHVHGAQNLTNLNIIDRGLYDYIQQNSSWEIGIEGYTKRPYSYIIVWRFYIPNDYPETEITRIFGAWYYWYATIRPDGTSTIIWPYPSETFNTTIFTKGHSYLVVWAYANYSLIQQDAIFIYRDDGAFETYSPSSHNPYSNDFLSVAFQNATFPLENLIVFWDLENNQSAYITALNEIDDYALQYTTVELYNPTQHDEQVYFIEKITYEVEQEQQPKNLYTLELSDITALETVVAPFSINYTETTIHDTDGFGRTTYYTITRAITPTYANYIRTFLHTLALFEMHFDFDYDLVVIGSNNRGNEVFFISTMPYNLKTGTAGNTSLQLVYASPYFQLYARIKASPEYQNEIWLQFVLINQKGEIRSSNWYLFSNERGYKLHLQIKRPVAVVDGVRHYVFIPVDVAGYSVSLSIDRGFSYLFRIVIERDGSYGWTFSVVSKNAASELNSLSISVTDILGGSAVMVKRISTKWVVLWLIHGVWSPNPQVYFIKYDDLDLTTATAIDGDGSAVANEMERFKEKARNTKDEYVAYNFDYWHSGSGEVYKGVVALPEVGAVVFTLDYDTSILTLDGYVAGIDDVKFISEIGAVAVWKGNIIFWRRDLPNFQWKPQFYRLVPLDNTEEICYIHYSDDSNGDYFQTVFARSGDNLYATPPRYDFTSLFLGLPPDGEVIEGMFGEVAKVDVSTIKNFHEYEFMSGRNHFLGRIEFRTISWSPPGRYRIGLPIKMSFNLWGFNYDWFAYLYISEQATPLVTTEWNANVKESIFKWAVLGEIQQGQYRLSFIFKWQRPHLMHGRLKGVKVYDVKQEVVYVKYVIASRYIEGIIWDYLTENDTYAIDDIQTSQEIIERLDTHNYQLVIATLKTPDAVFVGDIITFDWSGINQGNWKVIKITRDNNYITTVTAVKLPV